MDTETKIFPLSSVLSVVTGRSCQERGISGVYEVLNWMTGEDLYTHQLPRVAKESVAVLISAHPVLADAEADKEAITAENFREWLSKWEAKIGRYIAVPRMRADQHERIDAMSELSEKIHPDRIIVIRKDQP